MTLRQHLCALLLTAVFLGATCGAAEAQLPPEGPGRLFIPLEQVRANGESRELAVTRSRRVSVDPDVLRVVLPGAQIEMNLFDDLSVRILIDSVTTEDDVLTWIGQAVGEPLSQVVAVSSQGEMVVDVSMPTGIYQVRPAGAGVYTVQEIDQAAYPEEMPPVEIGPEALDIPAAVDATLAEATASNDDGSVIDVLVLFTPQARSTAGGQTSMLNLINLAVAEANQSYVNSGISQRLRLVHAEEVSYTESGSIYTDLQRLQNASDGRIDQVAEMRNEYGADLVSLITEEAAYCGVAYLLEDMSQYYEEYAFSVVARSCATGYYSFAHELGHNMGARHDWYVDASTTLDSYGHGYVNVAGRWRTIMAYNNECAARGTTCTRLAYWSNPNIQRNGNSMGVAGGTSTACRTGDKDHPKCDADDHRTLTSTAYIVANFRQSVTPPVGNPNPLTNFAFKNFLSIVIR